MDEILAYLKENPTYYLATVDANGDPQIRPFGTIAQVDCKLYIQTGKVKEVYRQILAHPRAAICTMGKDGTWIRIEADFIPDDAPALCDAILDQYPELRPMYAPGDGNCTALRLENIHATLSSFEAPTRVLAE